MKKTSTKQALLVTLSLAFLLGTPGYANTGVNDLEKILTEFAVLCKNTGLPDASNALNQEQDPKNNPGGPPVYEFYATREHRALECLTKTKDGKIIISATSDPVRRGVEITGKDLEELHAQFKDGGTCTQSSRTVDGPGAQKIVTQVTTCAWGPEKFSKIFKETKTTVPNDFIGCRISADHGEVLNK